jgi:hypothetical protein
MLIEVSFQETEKYLTLVHICHNGIDIYVRLSGTVNWQHVFRQGILSVKL